jgi:hypothetical protein
VQRVADVGSCRVEGRVVEVNSSVESHEGMTETTTGRTGIWKWEVSRPIGHSHRTSLKANPGQDVPRSFGRYLSQRGGRGVTAWKEKDGLTA